jgi:hypothetical protein
VADGNRAFKHKDEKEKASSAVRFLSTAGNELTAEDVPSGPCGGGNTQIIIHLSETAPTATAAAADVPVVAENPINSGNNADDYTRLNEIDAPVVVLWYFNPSRRVTTRRLSDLHRCHVLRIRSSATVAEDAEAMTSTNRVLAATRAYRGDDGQTTF